MSVCYQYSTVEDKTGNVDKHTYMTAIQVQMKITLLQGQGIM